MRRKKVQSSIQEVGPRGSPLGPCLYIRIARHDERPMGWEELWQRFAEAYPGQWALQVFPPASHLINEQNVYHLFVFEDWPEQLTINRRS